MKKNSYLYCCIFFLFNIFFVSKIFPQNIDTTLDENSFIREFNKACQVNNTLGMKTLVIEAKPFVFNAVISFVDSGFTRVAKGVDGTSYLNKAELIAEIYNTSFSSDKLFKLVKNYKKYDKQMCEQRLKGEKLLSHGISTYQVGRRDEGLNDWQMALDIFIDLKDDVNIVKTLNCIGVANTDQQRYTDAFYNFGRVQEIAKGIGDLTYEAKAISNISGIYQLLEQYDNAIKNRKEALKLFSLLKDESLEANELMNIGITYHKFGQNNKALDYLRKGLELSQRVENKIDEVKILSNIGAVYCNMEMYPIAYYYLKSSIEKGQTSNNIINNVDSYYNFGIVNFKLGYYETALDYSGQALNIYKYKILKDSLEIVNTQNIIERIYSVLKQNADSSRFPKSGKNSDVILDGNFFVQNFINAMEINDREKMIDLVRRAKLIIFQIIKLYTTEGITNIEKGYDGSLHFEVAEKIAEIYAEELKSTDILQLVKTYKTYNSEMCNKKIFADSLIKESYAFIENNQLRSALQKTTEAKEIFVSLGDSEGISTANMILGTIYYKQGNYEQSLEFSKKALGTVENIGDFYFKSGILNNIGLAMNKSGHYDLALSYLLNSLQIDRMLNNENEECTKNANLGLIYKKLGQYKKLLECSQRALNLSIKLNKFVSMAIALGNIGEFYEHNKDYNSALHYFHLAALINKDIGEKKEEGGNLIQIGLMYIAIYQFPDALKYTLNAFDYSKMIPSKELEMVALADIGRIKEGMNKYDDAIDYFNQALSLNKLLGDKEKEAEILNFKAETYHKTGRYKEALDYLKQAFDLSPNIDNQGTKARLYVSEGDVLYDMRKFIEAKNNYQRALEIALTINDKDIEARCLSSLGYMKLNEGKIQEAKQNLNQSLNIYNTFKSKEGSAHVLMGLALMYAKTENNLTKFVRYSQESLEIYRNIGMIDKEALALTLMGLGYNYIGYLDSSLEYYKEGLKIYKKLGNKLMELHTILNMGDIYVGLGNYDKASEQYSTAKDINKKIGDKMIEASCNVSLGSLLIDKGNYSEGINLVQLSSKEQLKMSSDDYLKATVCFNIGNNYLTLGLISDALKYFNESYDISRKIDNHRFEADALKAIAIIHIKLGNYLQALFFIKRSINFFHQIGDKKSEAEALRILSIVYYRIDNYQEAINCLEKVRGIDTTTGDIRGKGLTLLYMGKNYFRLGQYEKVNPLINESIAILEKIKNINIFECYRYLGAVLWQKGELENAVPHYERAIKEIEDRFSATYGLEEESRSYFIKDMEYVYMEYFELLLELHGKFPNKKFDQKAFTFSEKAKSRIFKETMSKVEANIVFANESKLQRIIQTENNLNIELISCRTNLQKETTKPYKERNKIFIDSLENKISLLNMDIINIEKKMKENYPRYSDLKRPTTITTVDVQKMLNYDELFISYYIGNIKSGAFIISKNNFKLVELALNKEEIEKLISEFRKGIDNISEISDLEKFNPLISYTLYQKIFKPLLPDLEGKKNIYVSADDILYTLPFEALVDSFDIQEFNKTRSQGKIGQAVYLNEYNTLHYVSETYTFTYLPSATVFRSLNQFQKIGYGHWQKPLVAFADPIFSSDEIDSKDTGNIIEKGIQQETILATQLMKRSLGNNKLKRLKESAEEAKAIAQEFQGKVSDIYLRSRATEKNVYSINLKTSRFLLFSTHGLLGGEFSGIIEPSLALTLIDNPPGLDGFLTMSEVLGLDLNAEMVILSACNTYGQGEKAGKGEGFAGFTRSFMYAGAKSLLITQWSVESQAAKELMINTFRAVKAGARTDSALKKAKFEMKNSTFTPSKKLPHWKVSRSHPYFWAPFVLVGKR